MEPSVARWLQSAGAQHDVVEWAEPFGGDVATLWDACPRGDWLLGLAAKLGAEREALVLAAARCARDALDFLPEDERRPDEFLARVEAAAARAELHPEAHEPEREALNRALDEAADPATAAAVIASLAVLDTLRDAQACATAAAYAVQAAVLDAADCGLFEAVRFAQRTSAERVREVLTSAQVRSLWDAR